MTNNSMGRIPYWDGKAESFRVYVSKIEAHAQFIGIGDALNPVLMANWPTRTEIAEIGITKPENQSLIDLYRTNKKLRAQSGQESLHGFARKDQE